MYLSTEHEVIKQVVETLQKVHRDKALSQLTVCQWLDIFKQSVLMMTATKKTFRCFVPE